MIDLGNGLAVNPDAIDAVRQNARGFAQADALSTVFLRGGQTINTTLAAADIVAMIQGPQ